MKKRSPLIMAVTLTILYLLLHLFIMDDYGLSWDFHYHHFAGLNHLGIPIDSEKYHYKALTLPDSRLTVEDPFGPFTQIIPTISYLLFYEKLHLLPLDNAYNLPMVIFGALGVGLIFMIAYEMFGWIEGLISAVFLGLLPTYFGYIHNNMKDIPNAFAFALSIYLFYRLEKRSRFVDLILAVLAFAFAFNIKVNSIFIPVICFLWVAVNRIINSSAGPVTRVSRASLQVLRDSVLYINSRLSRLDGEDSSRDPSLVPPAKYKRSHLPAKPNLVLLYFILAPLAAALLWWPFWRNPLGKLLEIPYFYSHNTLDIPVLFLGKMYLSGRNIPWIYPYIYILITTPPVILVSFILGLGIAIGKSFKKNKIYLLLVLWFFIPLLRYFDPKSGAIDGMRHFMEVVYPIGIIGGVGGAAIYKWIVRATRQKTIGLVLCLLSILSLFYSIIHFHPYQTSYFNILIGGIKGAQGKFDIDFWGTPQKGAMLWLNKNVPYGSAIYVAMAQSTAGVYLRPDLVNGENSKAISDSDFVAILNRQSFFGSQNLENVIRQKSAEGKVVYTREIDNVPLVWVFKK